MLEKQYAPEESRSAGAQEQAASTVRINTLKELTLALLSEVESMKDAQPLDAKRSVNFSDEVRRFEIDLIRWALMRTGGHQRRAARLLSIKVTTLNAKIKRYGIQPSAIVTGGADGVFAEPQREAVS